MSKHRLDRTKTLNYNIFDIREHLFTVETLLINVAHRKSKTPLMADFIFIATCIFFKFVAEFIDCIVRQVHKHIGKIVASRWLVFLSCKAAKSLIVEINPQRIDSTQQYVDSKIKLQFVDKECFVDVALYHVVP